MFGFFITRSQFKESIGGHYKTKRNRQKIREIEKCFFLKCATTCAERLNMKTGYFRFKPAAQKQLELAVFLSHTFALPHL